MKDTIICDLDGTLCEIEHRRQLVAKFHPDGTKNKHRDFDAFEALIPKDTLNVAVRSVLDRFLNEYDPDHRTHIIFVTGRHERSRTATESWLDSVAQIDPGLCPLYMRSDDDYRADHIVKQEILDTKLDKSRILFCLDDRQQVVDMWRRNGLTCFQVAEGNF